MPSSPFRYLQKLQIWIYLYQILVHAFPRWVIVSKLVPIMKLWAFSCHACSSFLNRLTWYFCFYASDERAYHLPPNLQKENAPICLYSDIGLLQHLRSEVVLFYGHPFVNHAIKIHCNVNPMKGHLLRHFAWMQRCP